MKITYKFLLNLMIVALTVGFTACQGDEGDIGPVGDTGIQGDKGTQGEKGDMGDNGLEATSFGNIEATISGKTPDGDAYTETIDFKYLPEDMGLDATIYSEEEDGTIYSIIREYKPMVSSNSKTNNNGFQNSIGFLIFIPTEGDADYEFGISANIIQGGQYFTTQVNGESNIEITTVNHNITTGELTFDFEGSYEGSYGTVTISGSANVKVLKGQFFL